MSKTIKCPYCNADNYNSDFYEIPQDEPTEAECKQCGKKFLWKWEIDPYFTVIQADCLNNGNHRWKQCDRFIPKRTNWVRCKDCGKEEKNEKLWNILIVSK